LKSKEKDKYDSGIFSSGEHVVYGERIFHRIYDVEVFQKEGKSKVKRIDFSLYQNATSLVAEYVSEDNESPRVYKKETGLGWSSDLSHPGFFSGIALPSSSSGIERYFPLFCAGGEDWFRRTIPYENNPKAQAIIKIGDKVVTKAFHALFGSVGEEVFSNLKDGAEVLAKRAEKQRREYVREYVEENFGDDYFFRFYPEETRESGFLKGGDTRKTLFYFFRPELFNNKGYYFSNLRIGNSSCQGGSEEIEIVVPFDLSLDWKVLNYDPNVGGNHELYLDFDSGKALRVPPYSSSFKHHNPNDPSEWNSHSFPEKGREGFDVYFFQDHRGVRFLGHPQKPWSFSFSPFFEFISFRDGTFQKICSNFSVNIVNPFFDFQRPVYQNGPKFAKGYVTSETSEGNTFVSRCIPLENEKIEIRYLKIGAIVDKEEFKKREDLFENYINSFEKYLQKD
jgi:hypothetical protein